ncbi:hypothetical protein ES703_105869 [subsurface metagenome]
MLGQFFILFGFKLLPECLGLHSNETDTRLMARLNGSGHFGILHHSEIIGGHYRINPAKLGCSGKALGHILVGAETEKPYLLPFLFQFDPSL